MIMKRKMQKKIKEEDDGLGLPCGVGNHEKKILNSNSVTELICNVKFRGKNGNRSFLLIINCLIKKCCLLFEILSNGSIFFSFRFYYDFYPPF